MIFWRTLQEGWGQFENDHKVQTEARVGRKWLDCILTCSFLVSNSQKTKSFSCHLVVENFGFTGLWLGSKGHYKVFLLCRQSLKDMECTSSSGSVSLPRICAYWFQGDAHLGSESAQLLRSNYDIMNVIIKNVGTVEPAKISFQNANSLSHEMTSVTAKRPECFPC